MCSGLEWTVYHPGQCVGPYGRPVPVGRVVLDLAPAGEWHGAHTVVEQSPEELLAMFERMAGEVRPDVHGRVGGVR